MARKILLLQFRENQKVAQHERDCLLKNSGLKESEIITKNIFKEKTRLNLKLTDSVMGLIIGGSGEFSFSEKTKTPLLWRQVKSVYPFIKKLIQQDKPVLGICLGHQILGNILGVNIASDSKQKETGSYMLFLTKEASRDKLFKNLPQRFIVQMGHKDSLMSLPSGSVLLAKTQRCRVAGFRYKNNIYGIQFHPELTQKDILVRLSFYKDYTLSRQKNLRPSPQAKKVLHNFVKICFK